ncbi:SDR family oxidoreductase [Rhizobium sp. RU20A]|uniref:SDR family NAD(P)-dependent oxidoreductase n=1 Tax=Rhizobium sp. RU20A TaxID=1907412 RepID=UPI00122CED92
MPHVIITGGSSGIGLTVARLYRARGARVTLIARGAGLLDEALALLGTGETAAEAADVADRAALEAAIVRATERFGPCTILVSSAGIVEPGAFADQPADLFDRQIAVNLTGTANAVRAVLPSMRQAGGGRIMLVSSGAGLIGIHGYAGYCASKYALRGYAGALRSELKASGIAVSICYPPDTQTPQFVRELASRPPEAQVIMGTVKPVEAESVARGIVGAIDTGRFETFFTPTLWALARLGPLAAPLINAVFDRQIAVLGKRNRRS